MTHIPIDESLLDTPIDRLIKLCPDFATLFLASRMDCVGCDFDRFHSLRTALDHYGIDHNNFIEELAAYTDGDRGGKL